MDQKYTKELFDNLPLERKNKIMEGAIRELAARGINGCTVRDIARRIGISHGSLFHYFSSKDDLIHTIIQEGVKEQQNVFTEGMAHPSDFFKQLEAVLKSSMEFSLVNRDIISIWLELSQPYQDRFTRHTLDMEKEGILFIKEMVRKGKAEGSIREDLDEDTVAYMIDSLLANLIKSVVSGIEQMKFAEHFGNSSDDMESIINRLIALLKSTLSKQS